MASRFPRNLSSPFAFWGRNLLLVLVATGGTILTVGAIASSQNPSKPTQPTPSQPPSESPQPAPTPWPSPHSSQPSPQAETPKQPPQNSIWSEWLSGLRFIEQNSPEYPVENTRPLTPN
ncbi:hypothetical protein PN462_03915, partial [Spirulina sp. CS-785/01]|nr:hypothetical protein [Spirulina sp. CS-785/01]